MADLAPRKATFTPGAADALGRRLYRLEEAAVIRGVCYTALLAQIRRGEVRTVKIGKRGVRITAAELERSSR